MKVEGESFKKDIELTKLKSAEIPENNIGLILTKWEIEGRSVINLDIEFLFLWFSLNVPINWFHYIGNKLWFKVKHYVL